MAEAHAASSSVVVLGAGLAGLAAGQALLGAGVPVAVFDAAKHVGGHAASRTLDGFTFDEGPHVSFTRDAAVQRLFAEAVGGAFVEARAEVRNAWRGHLVPHPAQCHLYGLPADVVERCIVDLARRDEARAERARDFGTFCRESFGDTFAELFVFAYTRKYWTAGADELATDWVGPRMHRPSLAEMVRGALRPVEPYAHYITTFRYPTRGGFGAYLGAFRDVPVTLGHRVESVDLGRRVVDFASGRRVHYEHLVSSLPLPELIRRIRDVPAEVRDAAARLACTSVALVSLGLKSPEGLPDAHWMYFYDEDVPYARAHFPHRLSPHSAPPGRASIQLEVYHSPRRPLPCDDVLGRVIDDALRTGLVRSAADVCLTDRRDVRYANVISDHARSGALESVRAFLAANGVETCGRYGEWGHHWSDESIASGWRAAARVVERTRAGAGRA